MKASTFSNDTWIRFGKLYRKIGHSSWTSGHQKYLSKIKQRKSKGKKINLINWIIKERISQDWFGKITDLEFEPSNPRRLCCRSCRKREKKNWIRKRISFKFLHRFNVKYDNQIQEKHLQIVGGIVKPERSPRSSRTRLQTWKSGSVQRNRHSWIKWEEGEWNRPGWGFSVQRWRGKEKFEAFPGCLSQVIFLKIEIFLFLFFRLYLQLI